MVDADGERCVHRAVRGAWLARPGSLCGLLFVICHSGRPGLRPTVGKPCG